ncbi:MAG: glycosyltransferase family 2 protein [Candidatus Hydrogenedens sp.]|nr:glycosyltransferase family 2 protein [Candidatus Hydrogenedens sp.]
MKIENTVEISIVIPVYNEEENITTVLDEIIAVMDNLGRSYEIITVDDGSKDNTFEILKKYHGEKPQVKVIRLTRNFGQHPALYAGFNYSQGNVIVTIDADGQNPPQEIPTLIKTLEEGNYDFVQGWRQSRQDSIFRTFFSRIVNWIITKITRVQLMDMGCGMACFNRPTIKKLIQATHHSRYIPAEVAWMGLKINSLPITQRKRKKGRSRYKIWSLFWINFDIIASISTLPVEIMGFIGFLFAIIGFGIGLRILLRRILWNMTYNDMATVTALFFILVGVQILCTSILCAYISRTYREVQHRPYYIIEQVLTDEHR